MAYNRRAFGGSLADWAFAYNSDGSVSQSAGATITFWSALSGGTQYPAAPMPGGADDGTGLMDGTGTPISSVTCDANGELPDSLLGPDNVYAMAADANGGSGPRRWVVAHDFGGDLVTLLSAPGGLSNPMTAAGDLTIGGAAGTPTRLPAGTGTHTQALALAAGVPAWLTLPMLIVPPSGDTTGAQDIANINAAITALGGVGDIWLLAGTYYFATTLTLPWSMGLHGQRWGTVINFLGGSATVTTPAVPATATTITNTTGQGVVVTFTGGTFINNPGYPGSQSNPGPYINGVGTGYLAQPQVWLPAGATIELFYSAAPTWTWTPINSAIFVQDSSTPASPPSFTGLHWSRGGVYDLVIDGSGAGNNAVLLDFWDLYGGYELENILLRAATGTNAVGIRFANQVSSINRFAGKVSIVNCTTHVLFTSFGDEGAIEHINLEFQCQLAAGQTGLRLSNGVGLQSCDWRWKFKSVATSGPCIQQDIHCAFQACHWHLRAELVSSSTTAYTVYYPAANGNFWNACTGLLWFSSNYVPSNIRGQTFQFLGAIVGDAALTAAATAVPYSGYGNTVITPPAIGASGHAVTNNTGVACNVYFNSGTLTAPTQVAQVGQAAAPLGITGTQPITVPNGGTITPFYSGTAPTWTWAPVGG